MDLNEVQTRVDSGKYVSGNNFDFERFSADLSLVWKNAMDFNHAEGTNFGVMARLLEQTYERRLAQVRQLPGVSQELCSDVSKRGKQGRSTLRAVCTSLSPLASTDLVAVIENAYPAAVKQKRSQPDSFEAFVDLDALDSDLLDELLHQARKLQKSS
jgi:hypothetical protein